MPHVLLGSRSNESTLLHVGVIANLPAPLPDQVVCDPVTLELQDGLEQLRFLDKGLPAGDAIHATPGLKMIELKNPGGIALIEADLARRAALELV